MIDLISTGRGKHAPDAHITANYVIPAYDWPPPPPAMRQLNGLSADIQQWVAESSALAEKQISWLVDSLADSTGDLTVAFVCNEGLHRSVAGAEITAQRLRDKGIDLRITHTRLGVTS